MCGPLSWNHRIEANKLSPLMKGLLIELCRTVGYNSIVEFPSARVLLPAGKIIINPKTAVY